MLAQESNRFLLLTFLVFLGLVIFVLSGFLTPLVIGILLASFTRRLYGSILARLRGRTTLSALMVVTTIIVLVIIPFLGLATLIAKEAFDFFIGNQNLLSENQPAVHSAITFFSRFNIDLVDVFQKQVSPTLQNIGDFLIRQITSLLSNAFTLTLDFFIIILTVFYLLRDGKALGSFLIELSPLGEADSRRVYRTFQETGRAVLYGTFVSALAQGTLGGIGFFLFGFSSPVLWGAIITFLALIPLLGAYIVFLPAVFYLFATAKPLFSIAFLLYNVLLVSTVDNIIKPKLISAKTNIHPLFAVLTIFGGIKLFGLLGIVYGPLIAAIFLVLFTIYKERVKPTLTASPPLP